ncbi:SH3 domain-containing protein 1-like isoform X2 [Nicotiana sylvestris]|uniref:SH3 domain-containing protein 2 n=2 Tax=Nicotiana TaxID=4085 RepID=A0A1S4CMP1_TOBAC|nr:PREDICTED: endophilin-A2-like isoform X1 [Nicotiana sylvestris]XP_016502321.1 PREDICTED: SH3 domain-containing protein 2-like [Nicotiana tabacum]
MEAIKKQATKLREQVAKQQQAILRQLGHLGHESVMVDEAELEIHQRLQDLYMSTRAAKHFQRDIVRGVEGYLSTSKKQMEIARKLSENCYKYGCENQNGPSTLPRIAVEFGTSHAAMEDQREIMLGVLGQQVCEPLRASIHGAPLEDARHLTHRYDRMRQEFEAQAAEVIRRQSKFRDASTESLAKLKNAETRLSELKSSVLVLGKEATDAMLSVEEDQQQITFQKLLTMVDAERSYHQNVVAILEKLHSEMLEEEQLNGSSPQSSNSERVLHDTTANGTEHPKTEDKSPTYFIAKVIHSFDAQADGELSLEAGDYVVVRQVTPNGWSEGECKGKSGWFPSAYAVKSDKVAASKMVEKDTTP